MFCNNLSSSSSSMLMATAASPSTISNESAHASNSMSEPLPPSLMFFISNVHHLIPIKLDLYNYTIWKIQCEGALKASTLFQHVQESEAPSPTITDPFGTSIPNPLYPKWVLADSFIRSCLISTLTPDILVQAMDFHTAPVLWKFLEQKFTSGSPTIFNLRLKLVSYQKSPNQSVGDFLKDLTKIAEQLAEVGSPVSKVELIHHSLRGLPPEFDSIKPVIHGLSLDSYIEDVHICIVFECSKLECKSPVSQVSEESCGGLNLVPNKFGSWNDQYRVAPFQCTGAQSISLDAFGTSKSFSTTTKAPHLSSGLNSNKGFGVTPNKEGRGTTNNTGFGNGPVSSGFVASTTGMTISNKPTPFQSTEAPSPPIPVEPFRPATSFISTTNVPLSLSNQWNATSHLSSNRYSNNWFGASLNKEWKGISDGLSVPATSTGFSIGHVAHGGEQESEKERIRKEIFSEETECEHGHLADKEVRIEVRSGKDTSCHRVDGLQGFTGSSPPITGLTILKEPKLEVMDQANSKFLKDSATLSFEEKMDSQAPQGSGKLQTLTVHGSWGRSGPQISQTKPETNKKLSGSKRKTLSPPSGASYLSSFVSKRTKIKHWNCAICHQVVSDLLLKNHLQSKKHKANELSTCKNVDPAGSVDAKIPSSQMELEGRVRQVKEKLIGGDVKQIDDLAAGKAENGVVDGKLQKDKDDKSYKFWCDMCEIGTDIEKVMDEHKEGSDHKERLQEPNKIARFIFNADLKEDPSAIFNLRLKLISLQKLPNQSVVDFLQELRKISDQLADAGSPVSKDEFIYHSLRGLPPELDSSKPVLRSLLLNSDIEVIHDLIVSKCSGIRSTSRTSTGFVSQEAKGTYTDFELDSGNDQQSGNQSRITPSQSTGLLPGTSSVHILPTS